jgi:hypothetical protein
MVFGLSGFHRSGFVWPIRLANSSGQFVLPIRLAKALVKSDRAATESQVCHSLLL